ncbi:hypothetical protein FNV43_RR09609 [Rhamnella rubrinervis]|uniref:DCD domain-containing protein n=1 Tax=Rhamnella rubrinervis TaxID=2594499 RepID=A0A8K0HB42_9ROSA|nr:hypothetical protein FNV43_RR09609 [Rhamnella rubrinervis]
MGAGRKTQTFMIHGSVPASHPNSHSARNLSKTHLGGVIFGCTNITMKECLSKQLFGLPAQHFSYVKNICPGLPLFLFNYSDRKLYGIFESASPGQLNINPYGWTSDGSERTQYPAQAQIRVRLQCQPLLEAQFKPIIVDNYYSQHHFWFELDHAQTSKLTSLLASLAVAPGAPVPWNTVMQRTIFRALPSCDTREESEGFVPLALEAEHLKQSSQKSDTRELDSSLDRNNQPLEAQLDTKQVHQEEKNLICKKLKELALKCNVNSICQDLSLSGDVEDTTKMNDLHLDDKSYPGKQMPADEEKTAIVSDMSDMHLDHKSFPGKPVPGDVESTTVVNGMNLEDKCYPGELMGLEDKNEQIPCLLPEYSSTVAQLVQEVKELKLFNINQSQKMVHLEQKLVQAEMEIQWLKGRLILEPESNTLVNEEVIESFDGLPLDPSESIFLFGGCNGQLWLSALDSYYPSQDVIKSLRPMSSVRSYASVAQLNGELYVIGGGNGQTWYDTVESYCPANDQWTQRPSLSQNNGSLAGATANNKIFAMGGGNGFECFSKVEMLDLDVGRWIRTRSMMQKRFALAAAELNGVLYATGGYDGNDYLNTVERFDPREHNWTKIASMNTKRGSHSLVVLNEKLYALGGFDGTTMVSSVEIFDPRLESWMIGEPMNCPRGYSAAAVVGECIYIMGGVKGMMRVVECYKEGQGWHETKSKAIGKRGFFSAIALSP